MLVSQSDTIAALSTPSGRSGIGVIRLSGPQALQIAQQLTCNSSWLPASHRVYLRALRDEKSGDVIDQTLITFFKSPNSFTGEDVIELSCHGSPVILNKILETVFTFGARSADPGEFTLRALANGKINLSQAEAIRDLIDAQTDAAAKQALRQLRGELSVRLQPIKDALLDIIVPLESSLEFVEDDLPVSLVSDVTRKMRWLISSLESLSITFRSGKLLKDGLKVCLVGRPNVGKSSIFNGLLSDERAIVTPVPGTTRDSLSELLNIRGVPVLLTDTAGVRQSSDLVESLGIERTKRAINESDLAIVVLDGSTSLSQEDAEVIEAVGDNPFIVVLNKSDLPSVAINKSSFSRALKTAYVSALTRDGLENLQSVIIGVFDDGEANRADFLITNARHYDLLRRALDSINNSVNLLDERASEELVLVGLYDTLRYLGGITGETTAEDVLTQIFSTFCIGK